MRRLCEAPDLGTLIGWRGWALLHTLGSSGCRVAEVTTLAAKQITMRDSSFFLSVMGKDEVELREAPLSPEAYAAILRTELGNVDTDIYCISLSMISATVW